MKHNPFSPAFPVNPKYFINRKEVLESFERAFSRSTKTEQPTPDNIAVLGDWGIGKTSLLRKLEELAIEKFGEQRAFSAIVELIPTSCTSFISFTNKIVDDVDRNFATQASSLAKIRNEIKRWRMQTIGIKPVIGLERKIREKSSSAVFEDALIQLWKIIEKTGVDVALIMLDDLHYLAEKYPDGLYDLRGVFQGLPKHGCNFMLCASGKRDMFLDIRELAEPLSRFFNIKHNLGLFELEETKNAILKPLKISDLDISIEEDVIKKIHALTEGHPFFIHFMMRELVSLKGAGNITLGYFDKNYSLIETAIEREKFETDWAIASDKERKILLAMAGLASERFSPSDIKVKHARTQLRFLLKKNLIKKHERGEYSLYHPLFKEYLKSLK